MLTKLVLLISVLLAPAVSQRNAYRGTRDYEQELPASRSSIDRKSSNGTVPVDTNTTNGQPDGQPNLQHPYQPLNEQTKFDCNKCLHKNYLIHYYERGCRPVANQEMYCPNGQSCPKYFDCPKRDGKKPSMNSCEYKGRVYSVGAEVPVDNPCKRGCYCDKNQSALTNKSEKATIRCAEVDCFDLIRSPQSSCYQVNEPGQCCSRTRCPNQDLLARQPYCQYSGRQYRLGDKIYPNDDYCTECTCDEHWNEANLLAQGINGSNSSCHQINCHMDLNLRFLSGCLPIYHERTCCPIDYYCPPPKEHQCVFDGRRYRIGERLDIGRNDRTDCRCLIPPDFTCVERSRPKTVDTKIQEIRSKSLTKQTNVTTTTGGTPQMAIQFPDDHNTDNKPVTVPKCPPFKPEGLQCSGIDCQTIIDNNGCQTCQCVKTCPVYKCQGSCQLVTPSPGQCPKCKCG